VSSTALLVCGLQNDLCSDNGAFASAGFDISPIGSMLPEARRVLTLARDAAMLVLHLPEEVLPGGASEAPAWREQGTFNGWPATAFRKGTWGAEAIGGFLPLAGEPVVPRHRSGGLSDTRAAVLLRSAGVRRVILVGAETHRAILATAIQAVCLDLEVLVPRDAVAGIAEPVSAAALQVLASYARLVSVDDMLEPRAVAAVNAAG
jgi:nicotinamidase-related amidase